MTSYKKTILFYSVIVFFIYLDRFLKFLAINDFFNPPIRIFSDFFKLNFAGNYNIAFSLPLTGNFLVGLVIMINIGLAIVLVKTLNHGRRYEAGAIFVVLAGSFSNLIDRVKFGYVIDYLDLRYFTVFNISDILIVVGVLLLIFAYHESDNKIKETDRN